MTTGSTGSVLLIDGATGTELERRGVDVGLPLWSARAILEAPEALERIHADYLEAGAQAITTNTFRTHRRSLEKADMGDRAAELTRRAVEIALSARDRVAPDARVLGAVAPLEDCYHPELSPNEAVCRAEHAEIMEHLLDAGVDGLLIETVNTRHEALAAADAARELAPGRWIISFCTKTAGPPGVLLHGAPMVDALDGFADAWAVGINCVAASAIAPQVALLRSLLPARVHIAAYGNIGHVTDSGRWEHDDGARDTAAFADRAEEWIEAGATVVGGCCGTTPDTVRALRERLVARGLAGPWPEGKPSE